MDSSAETYQSLDEDEMEQLQEETEGFPPYTHDHNSTKLLDCWQQIFDYLPKPSDKLSLFNTLPSLANLRPSTKSELLLQLALPILIQKEHIDPDAIVKCRNISGSIKNVVDVTLQLTQPWWLSLWYEFETREQIQNFMDYARQLNDNTTPFLAHSCSIHAQRRNCFRMGLMMFAELGMHLRHVRLSFKFSTTPRYIFRKLRHFLRHVPNIERLDIVDASTSVWEEVPEGRNLPRLSQLNELSLKLGQNGQLYPIIASLMTTYGPQLVGFSCNKHTFLAGLLTQAFMFNLLNVTGFQLDILDMSSEMVFIGLSQVHCPVLKILALRRDHAANAQDINFSNETVLALHNFCLSLRGLIMDSVNDLSLRLEPALLDVVFPKLKRLSVCTSNSCSSLRIWRLFQSNFPNLREIHFVTSSGRHMDPIPTSRTLSSFFMCFPRLKKIFWSHYERPLQAASVCSRFDASSGH
ncbi:unnamed protein product [Orchesella dallaii]|uniref:Uncharacterized protein n=1 Tax=Orchesella dallaii TaxID=48710 RepID=A0ABP1R4P1_9HEXA